MQNNNADAIEIGNDIVRFVKKHKEAIIVGFIAFHLGKRFKK